ncbi:MAG: hydroxyethylthiazole kinase [Chlorobiaceae bacterium]|nr:hydroxyethylthiazole kinase [Chlorobiaceae bacterium]NTW10063.1 hydroxyethylthiazole kinase [Chlorobiaceae bacterium]
MSDPLPQIKRLTWRDPEISGCISRLKENAPLVHCMTNLVADNFTANVLLASGASPAMIPAIEESGEFAGIAGALLLNLGTITRIDSESMAFAAAAAVKRGTPWVLDPVAVGVIGFRTGIAAELLKLGPSVIRGNASEIVSLCGREGGGKGVDSAFSSGDALPSAFQLARNTSAVVAMSGETDYITDGVTIIGIEGGHEMMTRVTAVGCALGALIAAMLPVAPSVLIAAAAASALFAEAGERAAGESAGPGSFAVAFLDQLWAITSGS